MTIKDILNKEPSELEGSAFNTKNFEKFEFNFMNSLGSIFEPEYGVNVNAKYNKCVTIPLKVKKLIL